MNTYNHKAACAKCGQGDIHNRFKQKGEYVDQANSSFRKKLEEDCIYRYCRNCGYTWHELPLSDVTVEGEDK